jgi:hypothetical protein
VRGGYQPGASGARGQDQHVSQGQTPQSPLVNSIRRKCVSPQRLFRGKAAPASALILLSSIFAGCATVGGSGGVPPLQRSFVQVESETAQNFYFMRRDNWDELKFDDPAKRTSHAIQSHGPFEIGSTVSVDVGMQYIFVPECSGKIEWDKAVRPIVPAGTLPTPIRVACSGSLHDDR